MVTPHDPDPLAEATRRFAEAPPETSQRARAEADEHEHAIRAAQPAHPATAAACKPVGRIEPRPHRLARWELRRFFEHTVPAGQWPHTGEAPETASDWNIWATVVPCPDREHPVLVWHAQQYGKWTVPETPASPRPETQQEVLDHVHRWAEGAQPLGVGEPHPLGFTCPSCGSLVDQWLLAAVRAADNSRWTQITHRRAAR